MPLAAAIMQNLGAKPPATTSFGPNTLSLGHKALESLGFTSLGINARLTGIANHCPGAEERVAPDVLLASANLLGGVGDVQDDPDSPDAAWMEAILDLADTAAHFSFPTPSITPLPGSGYQEFRVRLRPSLIVAPDPALLPPTARIELMENGSTTMVSDLFEVPTDGVFSLFWNASDLTDASGAGVELRILGFASVLDTVGWTVEIGAVEWNVIPIGACPMRDSGGMNLSCAGTPNRFGPATTSLGLNDGMNVVIEKSGSASTSLGVTTLTIRIKVADLTNSPLCALWCTEDDVRACCEIAAGTQLEIHIQTASELLYDLSGRQWQGVCEMTLRPCSQCGCDCHCGDSQYQLDHNCFGGSVWAGICGCNRCAPPRVDLGLRWVDSVTQVRIDGDVLAPSAYRLDENRYLTRIDGSVWPCTQNLAASAGDDGTFEVDVAFGQAPPIAGQEMAAKLACELAKMCSGSESDQKSCRLPRRTTSVTRQGVSMSLDSSSTEEGVKTGLYEVDLWLASVNPAGLRRPPRISSPGRKRDLSIL